MGYHVNGKWVSGPAMGTSGTIDDFRAGLLITKGDTGEAFGAPACFRSETGLTGTEELRRLLTAPTLEGIRCGAIREAIAAARAVSQYGFSETRIWDSARDYLVDTGEGSAAVVRFDDMLCVGVMVSLDPPREFAVEVALTAAPPRIAEIASEVLDLPFIRSLAPVTSVFWSDGGALTSHEEWLTTYEFGGEVLRRELLCDELWADEAIPFYGIDESLASEVGSLARARNSHHSVIDIAPSLFRRLIPRRAQYEKEAAELLAALGIICADGPRQ